MKLLIINNYLFHWEVIETVIVKYRNILGINNNIPIDIYLSIKKNTDFEDYISKKYPKINFGEIENYDYFINCTIYDKHFNTLDRKKSNKKYISHEITDRLKKNPNVYFLTPLSKTRYIYADILPYAENKKVSNIPIYIIQGNLNQNRRNLNLLKKILDKSYKRKFIIKLVGNGIFPEELKEYKNKIILRNNLNFINYHKEFLDAYCLLPLISKKTHPHYYQTKLTSTINYARGYKLKCLIDKNLQKIYNLENVEIYNDINDISNGFEKTLDDFYIHDE